jgi:hypothetical protein
MIHKMRGSLIHQARLCLKWVISNSILRVSLLTRKIFITKISSSLCRFINRTCLWWLKLGLAYTHLLLITDLPWIKDWWINNNNYHTNRCLPSSNSPNSINSFNSSSSMQCKRCSNSKWGIACLTFQHLNNNNCKFNHSRFLNRIPILLVSNNKSQLIHKQPSVTHHQHQACYYSSLRLSSSLKTNSSIVSMRI